jgi:hypothetical protein
MYYLLFIVDNTNNINENVIHNLLSRLGILESYCTYRLYRNNNVDMVEVGFKLDKTNRCKRCNKPCTDYMCSVHLKSLYDSQISNSVDIDKIDPNVTIDLFPEGTNFSKLPVNVLDIVDNVISIDGCCFRFVWGDISTTPQPSMSTGGSTLQPPISVGTQPSMSTGGSTLQPPISVGTQPSISTNIGGLSEPHTYYIPIRSQTTINKKRKKNTFISPLEPIFSMTDYMNVPIDLIRQVVMKHYIRLNS